MPQLILSTCGTSILTNVAGASPLRSRINPNANARTAEDFAEDDRANLLALLAEARERIMGADESTASRLSAELNTLHRLDGVFDPNTLHYLIASDTHLGSATANLVADYLRARGSNAQVISIAGLSTASATGFRDGIKELLRFLDDDIEGFGESHHVIFNLTGGFKSLLGFMTAIGNFYADEVVYVFESSPELLRIPKLPIRLDESGLRQSVDALLRMSVDDFLPAAEVASLSPALLEEAGDDRYGLSVWGELIWNRFRETWLADALVALPRITYEDSFKKDFRKLSTRQRVDLQQTLARVNQLLEAANGDTGALKGNRGGGLLYDQFSGKHSRYGHFRLNSGDRVSCEPQSGTLRLRHTGGHDYVNDNP